jgi:hypothetical protein
MSCPIQSIRVTQPTPLAVKALAVNDQAKIRLLVVHVGRTGPGLPAGVTVERVGEYLQWSFPGDVTKHLRLLDGAAPTL